MEATFIIIVVIVGFLIIRYLKSPKVRGEMGENRVAFNLGRNILNEKYVIHDLLLYNAGKSSQIDHLIIKKTGIFVIETKNYSGRIYGGDNQKYWTQVLAYGNEKHKLYNPIFQNKSHINILSKIIDRRDCFVSIIVFPKAKIMTPLNAYVGSIWDMHRWLGQNRNEILTEDEINRIHSLLINYKINPPITNEQHIHNIRKLQEGYDNHICPRCGSKLVERNGRYGTFYGCSRYPQCKFAKR